MILFIFDPKFVKVLIFRKGIYCKSSRHCFVFVTTQKCSAHLIFKISPGRTEFETKCLPMKFKFNCFLPFRFFFNFPLLIHKWKENHLFNIQIFYMQFRHCKNIRKLQAQSFSSPNCSKFVCTTCLL